jgi:glucose/mannose-6-phosphate isomerase
MRALNQTHLDDMDMVKRVDSSDMLSKLMTFGQQCQSAIKIGSTVSIPNDVKTFSNIVVTGLGGSAIGGDLLRAYLGDTISVPIEVNRNYTLPRYVSARSLLFVVSYSGNTEETLSAFDIAVQRDVPLICITSGGRLAERASEEGKEIVRLPGGYPPRTALGYLFFPMLTILAGVGFQISGEAEMDETAAILLEKAKQYHPSVPVDENRAKQLATRLHDSIPLLYASERLYPVARRWQTQIDENGESLAHSNVFPELNHNEIMSWEWLSHYRHLFSPVLFRDQEDPPLVRRRMDISAEMLESDGFSPLEVRSEGESRLARMFSLIYLGDFVSFYMAVLRGVDPTPVVRIESLKELLKR